MFVSSDFDYVYKRLTIKKQIKDQEALRQSYSPILYLLMDATDPVFVSFHICKKTQTRQLL